MKLEGRKVLCLDDADIYLCYKDLWLTDKERKNAAYYGIHFENTAKIRLGANDAVATSQTDPSIAAAFSNRFAIPLDFEILTDHGPFYQMGLTDRLSFELMFNDYARVIRSTDANVIHEINNIALDFDIVTHQDLARLMHQQYMSHTLVLYTRILRHRMIALKKSDVTIHQP